MKLRSIGALTGGIALFGVGTPAAMADDLASLLPRLLSSSVTMRSSSGAVPGNPHEAHFLPAAAQEAAPYALNKAIVTQLSTFPLGSSSGGFTYQSDASGIPQRSSGNFGPAFTERALTIGKGKFSAGFNVQRVSFDRFEGNRLDSGDIRFSMQHNNCCPGQSVSTGAGGPAPLQPTTDSVLWFEGDLVTVQLEELKIETTTTSLFADYGITDRLDVGVVVPIVSVDLRARMFARIDRVATGDTNPQIHSFKDAAGNLLSEKRVVDQGSKTGLGDVLVRSKLGVVAAKGGGLAAGLELRLPTGDDKNLLGSGAFQAKASLIYSGEIGAFAPRASVGYTVSSGSLNSDVARFTLGENVEAPSAVPGVYNNFTPLADTATSVDLSVPDEVNYTAGFSVAVTPRLTLNFDVLGRSLRDQERFQDRDKAFPYRRRGVGNDSLGRAQGDPPNDQPPLTATRRVFDLTPERGNVNLLLAVGGFKLNIARTLLLTGNVLVPITDSGLRAKVAPVIGLDYAF